jgi:DNA-binding SARP family transcriptional activator
VVLAGARLRVLLAALLLQADTPVAWEALAEVVWDGAPPPAAARTLRSHITRLRRALGAEAGRVVAREPGFLMRVQPSELDVLEFEDRCLKAGLALRQGAWAQASQTADRALALWRGEPLLDVPSQVLRDKFAPRLEQLRLQALEDRAEAELHLGRHERLISQLLQLTADYPLRERFHAQLMTALAGACRRAEALEAYRDARRILVEELGVEPGPQLRELHGRILAGEEVWPSVEPSTQQAPANTVVGAVPRQLPAAPGHFTGRHTELDLLAALARPADVTVSAGGTVVISAIDGMAGIGKTALAVRAGHRIAGRFPGGQLFVDLHGYTKGCPPCEPGDALEAFLRALGVPAGQIPEGIEARAALYRQRLAETSTLVLLDNALDEAQVRPLLPADPGCLVLVTSRRRLKGLDDARSMSLDVLPQADAVALLRAVAGADRIPADDRLSGEVARLCGHLPLALRIAGALLRHRPAWDLEHIAGLLRDQRRGLKALSDGERDLGSVFDLSYTDLDKQHRLLFRRLGLLPGPDTDAYAVAALLDADPDTVTPLLEDLVDHNLLIAHAPDRYRLHDLIRAHAAALAGTDPQPVRAIALDRLLHYYAHTAQSSSLAIARHPRPAPGGPAPAHSPALPDPQAARAWLRAERDNLEAASNHARTFDLDAHAVALAAGLAEILLSDGPWSRALEIHRAAAEAAGRRQQSAAHATALTDLGQVRYLIGDLPGAAQAQAQALEICREIGNRLGGANALTSLGRVRQLTGDFTGAVQTHKRALEVYREIGNRLGEANALTSLGQVRDLTGDLSGAAQAQVRALEIFHEIGNRLGEANALTSLGQVRQLTGDFAGAAQAQVRALEICREIGNRLGEANALTGLGRVRQLTGDFAGAADAQVQALEIFHEIGNRLGEANTLTTVGQVRQLAGDFAQAAQAQVRALEIYREIGNCLGEAWALNHYAATLAAQGDVSRALTFYRQALVMNRELNKPDDEAVALEGLGECHLSERDTDPALAELRQALEIYQRLGMAPDAQRVRTRLADLTGACTGTPPPAVGGAPRSTNQPD